MATKAELEAELAKLQSELSDLKAAPRATPDSDEAPAESDAPEAAAPEDHKDDMIGALKDGDIEGIVKSLMDELEDLPSRKPLLTALGAFIVGYMIGRSGSKG